MKLPEKLNGWKANVPDRQNQKSNELAEQIFVQVNTLKDQLNYKIGESVKDDFVMIQKF
jgi:hypothetical protein